MDIVDIIKNLNFFKKFNDDEIVLISHICKEAFFPKGFTLFKENTPADSFYFIISGQIKIAHDLKKLGEEELVILDKGECFGEMAFMDGDVRSASALAEEDTTLLVIEKGAMDQIMAENSSIAIKILTKFCIILSERLRDADKQISEMTGLFMTFRTKNKMAKELID